MFLYFFFFFNGYGDNRDPNIRTHPFPTRLSSDLTLRQPPRYINADRKRCCAVSLSTIMTVRVSCVFAIFSVPPPSHNDASAHLCRLSLSCRDLRHRGKRAIKGNGI